MKNELNNVTLSNEELDLVTGGKKKSASILLIIGGVLGAVCPILGGTLAMAGGIMSWTDPYKGLPCEDKGF